MNWKHTLKSFIVCEPVDKSRLIKCVAPDQNVLDARKCVDVLVMKENVYVDFDYVMLFNLAIRRVDRSRHTKNAKQKID